VLTTIGMAAEPGLNAMFSKPGTWRQRRDPDHRRGGKRRNLSDFDW